MDLGIYPKSAPPMGWLISRADLAAWARDVVAMYPKAVIDAYIVLLTLEVKG